MTAVSSADSLFPNQHQVSLDWDHEARIGSTLGLIRQGGLSCGTTTEAWLDLDSHVNQIASHSA